MSILVLFLCTRACIPALGNYRFVWTLIFALLRTGPSKPWTLSIGLACGRWFSTLALAVVLAVGPRRPHLPLLTPGRLSITGAEGREMGDR